MPIADRNVQYVPGTHKSALCPKENSVLLVIAPREMNEEKRRNVLRARFFVRCKTARKTGDPNIQTRYPSVALATSGIIEELPLFRIPLRVGSAYGPSSFKRRTSPTFQSSSLSILQPPESLHRK